MTAPVTAPTTATSSSVITNLDASPIIRPSAGAGGPGRLVRYKATITPTASQATSVLNRMVRVPSNCIIDRVALVLDTTSSSTINTDVGVWYSDANDGTSVTNQGNLTAISSAFFAYKIKIDGYNTDFTANSGAGLFKAPTDGTTVAGTFGPIDVTFANAQGAMTDANYVPSQSIYPLWQAIANSLALQNTPVGAFTNASQAPHFNTVSAGASVYVRSDDPGGFFDICLQLTTAGTNANQKITMIVDATLPLS